jgi:hypothetical protein
LTSVRRLGYLKNSIQMIGKLWEQLEHHILTGYGISEATYSSTVEKLLYGIGQGSCSSPILWSMLNQLLTTGLGEKFECIKLVSVDNSKTSTRPGDSFIDDTTTGATSDDTAREQFPLDEKDPTMDKIELIEQMQVVIQFFLDLLQVLWGVSCPREMCVVPYRTHMEKRCTTITSEKSEPSRDRHNIQCNRTHIRNQEKGGESGTPHIRVSSNRRWNVIST